MLLASVSRYYISCSLGHVRDRVGNGRQYVVEWPEGSSQVQVCCHQSSTEGVMVILKVLFFVIYRVPLSYLVLIPNDIN